MTSGLRIHNVMAAAVDNNYNWMVDGLIELSNTPVTEESSATHTRASFNYITANGRRGTYIVRFLRGARCMPPSPFGGHIIIVLSTTASVCAHAHNE